jgi:polar amino acid transport system substrate-binding protein
MSGASTDRRTQEKTMRQRHFPIAAAVVLAAATFVTACGGSGGAGNAVSGGCKPAHPFSTVEKGTLTVSVFDLPPFTKVEGKELTGVDGDVLKAIAKKECLTITVKPMGTAAVIPTVQAGRADVAAGDWYRTAKRAEIVNLTDPMYTDQMGLVSKDGVTKVSDLVGKTVGTVDGYLWVDDIKKVLGSSVKVYPTALNMNQDLKAGRIDVGIDSFGSAKFTNPNLQVKVAEPDPRVAASLQGAQAAFPVPKSNSALLAALNADIAELHSSGEMAKIMTTNNLPATASDTGPPRLIG